MFATIVALFLVGFSHARPEGFLDIDEADYSPAMIAARGIQATARQFEPIWVQTWPETPAPPDRLLLLSNGRIHSEGTPGEVITADNVAAVYGAESCVYTHPANGLPTVLLEAGTGRNLGSAKTGDR